MSDEVILEKVSNVETSVAIIRKDVSEIKENIKMINGRVRKNENFISSLKAVEQFKGSIKGYAGKIILLIIGTVIGYMVSLM